MKFFAHRFFISGSNFCGLVFVNFLIISTFALDVVNFARRHEWHTILIYTAY